MNYPEALAYLDSFVNLERHLSRATRIIVTLDRVRELAQRLGNPERGLRCLHVAGTKGKGSTCAFAASILRAAGLKTALYTSPHLQDVRERISIDGALISPEAFARVLDSCRPALEAMRVPPPGQRRPTYFEVLTHLAFRWFAEENVDVAVIEVGLGGRLDATNIVSPVACAITNISYDHMAILGHTLPQIARDKAGIMKPGAPVVAAPQAPEVVQALEESAHAARVPIEFVGRELQLEALHPLPHGERVGRAQRARGEGAPCALPPVSPSSGAKAPPSPHRGEGTDWPLPRARLTLPDRTVYAAELGLRGDHQRQNWAVAVRLADRFFLKTKDAHVPAAAVVEGSRRIDWQGRLEQLGDNVFLDGAHNDHSLQTVLSELRKNLPGQRLVVLFGCAKDKDTAAMLKVLLRLEVDEVLFTHSGNTRGKPPEDLAREWKEISGQPAAVYADCRAGLAAAKRRARDGVLLVTGSLYLVGAIKDL